MLKLGTMSNSKKNYLETMPPCICCQNRSNDSFISPFEKKPGQAETGGSGVASDEAYHAENPRTRVFPSEVFICKRAAAIYTGQPCAIALKTIQ